MAKSVPLSGDELDPTPAQRPAAATSPRGAVRRVAPVASDDLVPMQFKMPPEFAKAFRVTAANHDMKYNELFKACFDAFNKNSG